MKTKKVMLKVKIKSLAEEARIIRKEEQRCKRERAELWYHRVHVVRREARHSQLAYGFLRGRKYSQLESNASTRPNYLEISKIVGRFGVCWDGEESMDALREREQQQKARLNEWHREANEYLRPRFEAMGKSLVS